MEVFASPRIAAWYLDQALDPAERRLLADWEGDYAGKRVLDLGVGTGRTTAMLAPYASDYLGIDISEAMLARARANFPGVDLRLMDIRDIGALPRGGRDYVLASYAVLDVFDHDERVAVIEAARDVLRAGGLFVFSFHNLRWRLAGKPPQFPFSANPVRWARDLRQYAIGRRNYAARAALERRGDAHAMLRDMAHQWRGVFHYHTPQAQIAEVERLGFEVTAMIGADGRDMARDEPGLDDPMPHLRCRKR
ncbi:MAG: class I SAM-dependent methyltransferase [Rhodoblastus sp.]|nr:MAG: class I SAM-dependent methyltransferase [Rhodoblastus sp.]